MSLREALLDLIRAADAKDKKAVEKAYRFLEKVGMDRFTANIAASELRKELREESKSNG